MEEKAIYVATHKMAPMPRDTDLYVPLQVGAANRPHLPSFITDDTGDNISEKNPYYNELTGLYWAWQNSEAQIIGLVHYRRHFIPSRQKDLQDVLSEAELTEIFKNVDVILPTKRRYYIESNESHYRHVHEEKPLDVLREVVTEQFPEYLPAFDQVMHRTWAHMFNMMIMRRPQLDGYAQWLFTVLAQVEARVQDDVPNWTVYEQRVYGFLSELLLDVWLETHNIQYAEVPFVFMEKENWLRKGATFIARKFGFKSLR